MKFQDLIRLYEEKKQRYGDDAVRHVSEILEEAKQLHKEHWLRSPTAGRDHEQSWRSFKGKNFEKLVIHIIKEQVERLGLRIVEGSRLEKKHSCGELCRVKRNLLVDYGEFGCHLPDVDIIIYDPVTYNILAVVSSKVTLRERIAQTGYWKLKLSQDSVTKHIKVLFVTPDEDRTLCTKKPAKKGRAIVEVDTDGSYVMSAQEIEESRKVKKFERFLDDLRELADVRRISA